MSVFTKLMNLGIQEHEDPITVRKLRVINLIALASMTALFIAMTVSLIINGPFLMKYNLLRLICILCALFLNSQHRFDLGFFALSLAVFIPAVAGSYEHPVHSNHVYTILPYIVFVNYFYYKKPVIAWIYSSVSIGIFVGIQAYFNIEKPASGNSIEEVVSFSIIIGLFLFSNRLYTQENRRFSKKLDIANQQLNESLSIQKRLFSIIAHDLKSPFVSIKMLADMLSYQKELDHQLDIRQIQTNFFKQVDLTYMLLEDLITWSKTQLEGFKFRPEVLMLYDLIINAIEQNRFIWEPKSVRFRNQIPQSALIFADRGAIEFVLRNLLNNAIKFSHPNSTVIIGGDYSGQTFKMTIEDRGIGIDPAKIVDVFKIDGPMNKGTAGETGSGLGLYLSRTLMQNNGGDIFLKSELGSGTRVTVEIPWGKVSQTQVESYVTPEEDKRIITR